MRISALITLISIIILSAVSSAEVTLHALFNSHMVLQRQKPIPVFGWASAGEQVTVTLNGASKTATADSDGNWKVELDAMEAGGPYSMTVSSSNTITFEDVLVGDVYYSSGQSNMRWQFGKSADSVKADANIRFFINHSEVHLLEQEDFPGVWEKCEPGNAAGYFAIVAYYFAKYLQPAVNVPIGVINAAQGGSHIDNWFDRDTYLAVGTAVESALPIIDSVTSAIGATDWDAYYNAMVEYNRKVYNGETGQTEPTAPELIRCHYKMKSSYPMRSYNSFMHPCRNFAIKGVLWYQGEYNAGEFGSPGPLEYFEKLTGLIGQCRNMWNNKDLPFAIVQLPTRCSKECIRTADPSGGNWALIRQAQLEAHQATANTALCITIDTGGDLHPGIDQKIPIGERLALSMRELVYDKPSPSMGPIVQAIQMDNGKVRIAFEHIGTGLIDPTGDNVLGFSLGFIDSTQRKNPIIKRPATATLDGNTVFVDVDTNATPHHVYYAFAGHPVIDLENSEGIPASPLFLPVPFGPDDIVAAKSNCIRDCNARAMLSLRNSADSQIAVFDLRGRIVYRGMLAHYQKQLSGLGLTTQLMKTQSNNLKLLPVK